MSSRLVQVSLFLVALMAVAPVAQALWGPAADGGDGEAVGGPHLPKEPAPGTVPVAMTLAEARSAVGASPLQLFAWDTIPRGAGVRVAVVDTGIDPDHPDLIRRVGAWRDFVNGASEPYDDHGHGTHVAGIIAGHGHLQPRPDKHYFPLGAKGLAPEASLIVAKAVDAEGTGSARRVALAVSWALDPDGDPATDDGAAIINLSLGSSWSRDVRSSPSEGSSTGMAIRTDDSREVLAKAIQDAVRQGAVVVVSAGNQPAGEDLPVAFPASMREVITVGATGPDGRVAAMSRSGPDHKPDLVAPGFLLSAAPQDPAGAGAPYRARGGTSMAAAVVSGAAALLLGSDPQLLAPQAPDEDGTWRSERVRLLLTTTATPVPEGGDRAGSGALRVDAALRMATDTQRSLGDLLTPVLAVTGLLAAQTGTRVSRGGLIRQPRRLLSLPSARRAGGPGATGRVPATPPPPRADPPRHGCLEGRGR